MDGNHPTRILVVDDEPHVAMVLADALNSLYEPCDLIIAENASEALEQVKGKEIDLVITDYRMPGLDGLTLINSLRKGSPDMAAILITAYSSEQLKSQAAQNSVDRFMTKPFALDDIRRVVREVMSRLDSTHASRLASGQVHQAIAHLLEQLVRNIGARCACVIRRDGSLLDAAGDRTGLDMQVMATLMAANFAAMVEIARLLENPRSFGAVNHESPDDNIYTCTAGPDHLLAVIYGLAVKSGTARYYARRAVDELAPLLESAAAEVNLPKLDLGQALESAFGHEEQPAQQAAPPPPNTTAHAEWPRGETLTLDEAIRRGIITDFSLGRSRP